MSSRHVSGSLHLFLTDTEFAKPEPAPQRPRATMLVNVPKDGAMSNGKRISAEEVAARRRELVLHYQTCRVELLASRKDNEKGVVAGHAKDIRALQASSQREGGKARERGGGEKGEEQEKNGTRLPELQEVAEDEREVDNAEEKIEEGDQGAPPFDLHEVVEEAEADSQEGYVGISIYDDEATNVGYLWQRLTSRKIPKGW